MAKRRTTFGKMQRERDKKERMAEKLEKRAARADEETEETEPTPEVDQGKVIAQLDELHKRYDDGQINEEEFEERRSALLALLTV